MRWGRPEDSREAYRCSGCGARWSYEAVRFVALCPECASGLVRVPGPSNPDLSLALVRGRRARGIPPAR